MKLKSLLILLITLATSSVYSQSIQMERDTLQTLQDSDAGSVAAADIDQDGDQDLVITGSPGVATLYKNDGFGNFTAMTQPAIVNVYSGAAKFADVENDGDMDLMMTGNTSSPIATANLYLNDDSGNFTLAAGTPFEASVAGDIDFGDIDGDGDVDLIMTGKDSSGVVFAKLYVNDGQGAFSEVSGTPFTPVWTSSTEFIDVDNDNDLDLLICGEDANGGPITTLYENNGSGTFSVVTGTPFEDATFGDIAFGDTDNDGDQDILITGQDANSQWIANLYLNNGTSFSLLPNTPFPGVFLHSSAFADFNNDGYLDLLHLGNALGGLIGHIYENQGNNTFVLSDSTLAGSYNGTNVVVDLNGDNKPDVVTTGTSFTLPLRAPKIYFNQSIVAVEEPEVEAQPFLLYPNPSEGVFTIEVNSKGPATMELYDGTGRLVRKESLAGMTNRLLVDEAPGVYLLRIFIGQQVYTRRIQIQ